MQIKTTTYTIASPARDFASLEAITDEFYQYTLEFNVSKVAVKTTKAVSLIVKTYKNNPLNAATPNIFEEGKTSTVLEQNPANIIDKIRRQTVVNTSKIVGAKSSYLTVNNFVLTDLVDKNNSGIGYALIDNQVAGELNVPRTSNNNINEKPLAADRTIPQVSTNILKQGKTDPAQTVVRTYSTNTPYDTSNGTLGVISLGASLNNNANSIAGALLSTNNSKQKQQAPSYKTYMIAEQDQIPVRVLVPFEKDKIGKDNFYVLCTFLDDQNNIVQEFTRLVDNLTNITFFTKPTIPPEFQVYKQSNGQLALTFTQKDKNAFSVLLYLTVYNQTDSIVDTVQNLVGTYNVPYGQTQTFLIQNEKCGLLLFRALSYNGIDTSTDFSSQIIEINPPNEDVINNNVFVTLNYAYVEQGLKISVTNIPNDITWVKLYKTNLTIDQNTEVLVSMFNVGGMGSNNAFAYLDTDLDSEKNYCYRATVLDIYGNELDSTGLIEINYKPQVSSYASVTVTNPIIRDVILIDQNSVGWDVSFNVNYAIVPGLEQNVRNLLTSQNLIQYYGNDITVNELQQLLITKVELRDLDTNDKYFITFTDGNFVQSQTNFGIIKKPSKYTYELTTYTRHPTTLLQSNVQVGKSQPRPSSNNITPRLPEVPEYQYKPFNVAHPQGLLTGTVPKTNGKEFVAYTGYNQLEFGEIVDIRYIDVDLLPSIPSVVSLQLLKFNKNNLQLRWSIDGDQTRISHFIIRRQNVITGKLDLVGKCHGINVQNNYNFIDLIRPTDSGVYKYIVTIQFFDMTLSTDYNSNEVVI